ncbi:hypothetical protein COM36_33270 [Bacillus toyonensis]|uniref:hypothetical protein n=1 Tax=Bacillus toyonensis TaxID=155322 RepID=UPI000BF7623C|nr:hypothetical protein [Bacillus toyonensis]PGD41585.1 hypothetical protein COM36_33270 [Bacillus toyonensis]
MNICKWFFFIFFTYMIQKLVMGKIKQTFVYYILAMEKCLRYGMNYGGQWSTLLNYAFTI